MRLMLRTSLICLSLLLIAPASAQDSPNQDLNDLYGQGQKERVLELAWERLASSPDDRELNLLVGRCLVDLGRAHEGKPYLQRVVDDKQADWRHAWAQFYLGTIAVQDGDDDTARVLWTEVRDAKLTQNVARSAAGSLRGFALDEAFADWRSLRTEHCVFVFSPAHADRDLQEFADAHEKAWQHLTSFFGGMPPWSVRYVVWDSVEEARNLAGIQSLGFARPEACLVHCRWDQTLGHELTHVVSYQVLKPTARTGLINEGLAVCFDLSGRDRLVTAQQAAGAAGLTAIDLPAWWEQPPTGQDACFYPVAGAWVQTLLDRGGKEALLALCREQSLANAQVIYGDSLAVWMDEFAAAVIPTAAPDGGH